MNNDKVYIIILNWNSWQDTIECLESIYRQQASNYTVIVCDNASADQSLEQIKTWADGKNPLSLANDNSLAKLTSPPILKPLPYTLLSRNQAENTPPLSAHTTDLILIQTGKNLGFAGGNNVGLRYALKCQDMDYVWLLNNDTVVEPDCLDKMLDYTKNQAEKNICGSTIAYYNDPAVIQALGGCHYNKWTGLASTSLGRGLKINDKIAHREYEKQLSYISGASWLLPKDFLIDIGLMEESYFLYCEEIDWCVRNNNKYKLCYAPDAIVYHKEGKSIGSPNDKYPSSLLSDFYIFRNKLRFTRRYFPQAIISSYATSLFQAFNRARRGQWDKALLIIKVILGKHSYD
ncbi:MAG: glycosyltransferase family 2 protein [gamma proteobacterium symbiont of Taylorina sp.]|nr:glycosyltransferase family 2 protein [gamma proteobacterium symbiont of Taylorina sp.]